MRKEMVFLLMASLAVAMPVMAGSPDVSFLSQASQYEWVMQLEKQPLVEKVRITAPLNVRDGTVVQLSSDEEEVVVFSISYVWEDGEKGIDASRLLVGESNRNQSVVLYPLTANPWLCKDKAEMEYALNEWRRLVEPIESYVIAVQQQQDGDWKLVGGPKKVSFEPNSWLAAELGSPELSMVMMGEGGVLEQLQEGGDLSWMMHLESKNPTNDIIQYTGPINFALNSQLEFNGEVNNPADMKVCALLVSYSYGQDAEGDGLVKGWDVCNSFVAEVQYGGANPKPLMAGPWYSSEWLIRTSRPDTMYLIVVAYGVTDGHVKVELLGGPWALQYLGPEVVLDVNQTSATPNSFALQPNYPNPFNPETNISFDLDRPQEIYLAVYDLLGREVEVLVKGFYQAGSYSVQWSGVNQPSGVYLVRMQAGQRLQAIKITLQK